MKKIKVILSLLAVFALISCTGDRGPQGPQGPQGPGGGSVLGQVIEITVDFTPTNKFSFVYTFPKDVEVYESDAVLVYLLEDVVGNNVDVWAPLPQTYFYNQGTLIYTFNHTYLDLELLLDANFPLTNLPNNFTRNKTFRIAIVPMEFAEAGLSMEELMASGKIEWINQ